ncbi:MAG: helix-turn-helix transcriptional regulator [Pseudomonadota bacterium]
MENPPTIDRFRRLEVDGIESMVEGVRGATVEPTQLTAGQVNGDLTFADLGGASLSIGRIRGDLQLVGPLSDDSVVLGVVFAHDGPSRVMSRDFCAGQVMAFPEGIEHTAIYRESVGYLTLSVDRSTLRSLRMEKSDVDLFDSPVAFAGTTASMTRLRSIAAHIAEHPFALQSATNSQVGAAHLKDRIMDAFVEIIDHSGSGCSAVSRSTLKRRRLRETEKYARDRLHETLTATMLCEKFGVSRRTLHRAFAEEMGTSPAQYLRQWHLSQTRRALAQARPNETSVSEIAHAHGFFELGRFAQYYRQLFGEKPSETLKLAER